MNTPADMVYLKEKRICGKTLTACAEGGAVVACGG